MSDFNPNLNNPYRAPVTADAPPLQDIDSDAVTIRREHLKHEASIQGMGSLYVLGGIFTVLVGFSSAMSFMSTLQGAQAGGTEIAISLALAAVLLGIGVLQFCGWVGDEKS